MNSEQFKVSREKLVHNISAAWNSFLDCMEYIILLMVGWITACLPVKIIRDDNGKPFLYRYNLFSFKNGPGINIHRFVRSDPDRGFHDHPWSGGYSFILSGEYKERILNLNGVKGESIETHTFDPNDYDTYTRSRFNINCIKGRNTFHRVMIEDGKEAWTIFFFTKRSKRWGMIDLNGKYKKMSIQVDDTDGGWWKDAAKGNSVYTHVKHNGNVVATVDIIVKNTNNQILLIKRGKDPYKDCWALPGGRIEQKDLNIKEAAIRELFEETNIDLSKLEKSRLTYLQTIGNNERDPRGFTLTSIFKLKLNNNDENENNIINNVKAGDDAIDYKWVDIAELEKIKDQLAFDHYSILSLSNLD